MRTIRIDGLGRRSLRKYRTNARYASSAAERIREKAISGSTRRIVLSEGNDSRVCRAAVDIVKYKIADVTLLAPDGALAERPTGLDDLVNVIAPEDHPEFERLVSDYCEKQKHSRERRRSINRSLQPQIEIERSMLQRSNSFQTKKQAAELLDYDSAKSPLFFANLLVKDGLADGSVSGAAHASGNVVSSALRCIGLRRDVKTLSSFFVMDFPAREGAESKTMIFADCCVVVEPSADQLAEIAIASADAARHFLDDRDIRVGLLSFSTDGSSKAAQCVKVREAASLIRDDSAIYDGELQLDAACVPEIASSKAPNSRVEGRANVLIFPSLEAGNIGYKLAERFGGATAIGPILQGLERPANDLSRGCSISDVVDVAAATALQASVALRV